MAEKKPKTPTTSVEKKPKRARTDYCVHRRKPDEFCSRCDA